MKVGLSQLGKVEIDYNIHSLNVNSSCEEIYKKQIKTQEIKTYCAFGPKYSIYRIIISRQAAIYFN